MLLLFTEVLKFETELLGWFEANKFDNFDCSIGVRIL